MRCQTCKHWLCFDWQRKDSDEQRWLHADCEHICTLIKIDWSMITDIETPHDFYCKGYESI